MMQQIRRFRIMNDAKNPSFLMVKKRIMNDATNPSFLMVQKRIMNDAKKSV